MKRPLSAQLDIYLCILVDQKVIEKSQLLYKYWSRDHVLKEK